MANIQIKETLSPEATLLQMAADARYDVADSRDTDTLCIPDLSALDSIKAPAPPPKVPKLFVAGHCVFNCAYCGCRNSNGDSHCYVHEPQELARLAVQTARENGHGVFISSAIYRSADYTEELIIETIKHMRQDLGYTGYIHAKVMPGTDPALIEQAGRYADRLSVNIEVARSEGYSRIAKQKNKSNILTPMQQISDLIYTARQEKGRSGKRFAISQTTQLMAGSTDEDDRTIMVLSKALYRKYRLKRVYYSPFHIHHQAEGYDPLPPVSTPQWRTRRLYQADRLLQLYGFSPDDITPEEDPNLSFDLDPKAAWAIRNMQMFPVEVNTADYDTLLRVPGIGVVYAKKILEARRYCTITHTVLEKLRIPLKRCLYFIQCDGKYLGGTLFSRPDLLRQRLAVDEAGGQQAYEQMKIAYGQGNAWGPEKAS